jgi:hypothetical protein
MSNCNVCIENFNKSSRLPIKCGFCDYESCKECYKHYLTDSKENAHCMSCRKEWDYQAMVMRFDRKFVDSIYKRHRENILIDRERGLMVATQPAVELILLNRKRRNEIREIERQRDVLTMQIIGIQNDIYSGEVRGERKQFVRKCTKEECKGFLSTQWKCGLCENWSCPECHDVIGLEKTGENPHICDVSTLATAKLLDNDTKTCPKCSTGIFKIDGCDMMFCVECHTSFSWKSGRIETGVIHNPHYFEWLRKNGGEIERNPNEIRCGREIDQYFIREMMKRMEKIPKVFNKDLCRRVCNMGRALIHMRHIDLERFSYNIITDNIDLRVQYMQNMMNDEEFKRKLQIREKQNNKKEEYRNILTMFINCQTEIFYRIFEEIGHAYTLKSWNEIEDESKNLLSYTNECLASVSKLYMKNRPMNITDMFELNN